MMIIPPPDPPFGDTSLLTRLPLAAFALVIIVPLHAAEPWPMWRGTRLDGVATEHAGFPVKWSATENIAWKTEIPGRGHSSPIVWGDRIYVTSCVEQTGERLLICLDRASGAIRWRQTVLTSKLEGKHNLNSYASSTPATDGKHVWVTFLEQPSIRVACYDMDGYPVWMKSPGRFNSRHGFCSSPI